ncbi:MAG: asparaginase [Iodobacter sp.]
MPKLLLSLLMSSVACVSFAAGITKPVVEILATGGTIAGVAASQTSTTYQAGSLSAKQLIDSVSGLGNLAEIRYEQVYNKDSGDITVQDWLKLEAAVRKAAADPAINAIVITHGTDTLEETAYFLNLVAKTTKPVVLVGSMRAATSMSADGPMNLYNAVAVAVDKATNNRGVLVAMNEDIFAAREVQKTNTTSVQTFQSPGSGPLGHVAMGHVSYQANPVRANMANTPFSVAGATKLPEVAIVYAHVGMNTEMLNHLLETKDLKGIVMAGVGDGNIPAYAKEFLQAARKKGIVVVRSSRVGSGTVSYDYNNLDTTYDLIAGDNLAPGKARVLLMLSLMKTNNTKAIQQNFYTY